VALVGAYAFVACIAFGFLMNLWLWPFSGGLAPALAFEPGASLATNVQHWIAFSLATSLGYDIPRAVLTTVLILMAGAPVMAALRRATRRAAFGAVPRFETAVPTA
jgi:energy-coupling factor transport system substrate-specific component